MARAPRFDVGCRTAAAQCTMSGTPRLTARKDNKTHKTQGEAGVVWAGAHGAEWKMLLCSEAAASDDVEAHRDNTG